MTEGIKLSSFSTITDARNFYIAGTQGGANAKMLAELLTGESGFFASNVPYSYQVKDNANAETTSLTQNIPAIIETGGTEAPAIYNNLWEQVDDNQMKYIGETPSYVFYGTIMSGALSGGGVDEFSFLHYRNALGISNYNPVLGVYYGSDFLVTPMVVVNGDIVDPRLTNLDTGADWITRALRNFSQFGGFVNEEDALGPELFSNPNILDDTDFTASNATQDDTTPGELLVTTTAANGWTDASITGLEVGEVYRVVASAKRGAQGTDQAVGFTDWGNTTTTDILTTSEETVIIDILATATSGFFRFQAAATGSIGDEIIVTGLSVKKRLL